MNRISTLHIIFCIWIAAYCISPSVLAETTDAENPAEATEAETQEHNVESTVITLKSVLESIDDLKDQLKSIERQLRTANTEEQKLKAIREINTLNSRWETFEKDFERIATGVDPESFDAKPQKGFDWKQEIQDLLGPVIRELKNMTESPRQVEKLRSEIAYYQERIPLAQKAITNIQAIRVKVKDRELKRRLEKLEKAWINKEQQIKNQLTVALYQLEERTRQKRSILESTQTIVRLFFKSRGKNFLFAMLTFTAIFLILRLCHKLIYRFSPIHQSEHRTFFIRLGDVIYHMLSIVGATSAALIVLYVSGDWVLLILALIFLIGIAWTAKQGIFLFWEQIKLLLNLGAVRENERVIYNGIPWKVVSLNIYTHLVNPCLGEGRVRLPLKDLVGLTSRLDFPNEPWFPSKVNDWVVLDDGVFGQVISQSPEMVQIKMRGGTLKTYQTSNFLALNPISLANNFRIRVVFGIDYQHQPIVTKEVPDKLQAMLTDMLNREGFKQYVITLRVEFKSAGASSLDLEVLADFSPGAAPYYHRLIRLINRICVDACNCYEWVIPFTQLTVHHVNGADSDTDDATVEPDPGEEMKKKEIPNLRGRCPGDTDDC